MSTYQVTQYTQPGYVCTWVDCRNLLHATYEYTRAMAEPMKGTRIVALEEINADDMERTVCEGRVNGRRAEA